MPADKYTLNFPVDADPISKVMLTAAGVFIDFLLFEDDGSDKNNNGTSLERTVRLVNRAWSCGCYLRCRAKFHKATYSGCLRVAISMKLASSTMHAHQFSLSC